MLEKLLHGSCKLLYPLWITNDFAFCLFQLACVRDIILSKNLGLFFRLQLVKLNVWAAWRCCFSFV